jgi:hypothetical protein
VVLFPFIAWIAPITSFVLLAVLWQFGELGRPSLVILPGWFLVAAYLQFGSSSMGLGATGLLLQTILALYLFMRWKIDG